MATQLTTAALEESTYVITYVPKNHAGEVITPKTLVWSLMDSSAAIINSRNEVAFSAPDTSNAVVLTGDDLALDAPGTSAATRTILFKATYDATIDGTAYTDLVVYAEAEFNINPVKGVG